MLWEELSALQFEEAAKKSKGVCILPIGCIEKHGNHLPLGTDMYVAQAVCKAAAEREPAVVFPYYFMGQISEARHYPGTVAASHKLLMECLLEMCDEIARNGLKKILIMSGHGGNNYFLPFFAQEMPRLDRDYCVYTGHVSSLSDDQRKKIAEMSGTTDFGQHAGMTETSLIMLLRSDLVNMKQQDPAEGTMLGRLPEIEKQNLFTGFNWYANFPAHFAGDPSPASADIGAAIFDMAVGNVVNAIKAVKADTMSPQFVKEFAEHGKNPSAALKHSS